MSLVLGVLFCLIRLAWQETNLVAAEALRLLNAPGRYETGLRPVDLIHIGEFIQLWIPPK